MVIVGTHTDLSDQRAVSFEEARAKADELGAPYIEVSALNNSNIDELFLLSVANIEI